MALERQQLNWLKTWWSSDPRKPLILRGARQIGKSTLVREFARQLQVDLIEVNLEYFAPQLASAFAQLDVQVILQKIEQVTGKKVSTKDNQSILFLDEIQAVPEAFTALRYFFELLPELPVLAAGSALEFALRQKKISVPVGRVESLYMGPLCFKEWLANGPERSLVPLIEGIEASNLNSIGLERHQRLLAAMRDFFVVGGMPEPAAQALQSSSSQAWNTLTSILDSYRDDIQKYPATQTARRIGAIVFERAPSVIAKKLKYVNLTRDYQARDVKEALSWLLDSGILTSVRHTEAHGVPLGAEADDTTQKLLFLDIGLLLRAQGLQLEDFPSFESLSLVNEGALAEQFVGQELLYQSPGKSRGELHYWLREKRSQNAEVDYIISAGSKVIPIEVKAGARGTLRSLDLFCRNRQSPLAVRFDTNLPSLETWTKDTRLLSLPLYLAGEARRICKNLLYSKD